MSESERVTILGSKGFVGRHLVDHFLALGHEVLCPKRADLDQLSSVGHLIYAIGLTGDFRSRPNDTLEAHAGLLGRLLQSCEYESWAYLSTTRLYGLDDGTIAHEQQPISVLPSADTIYDLTKLLGESLVLALAGERGRVLRLSNVYGPGMSHATFLGSVLRDVHSMGAVTIGEHPDSAKDYVAVEEVACSVSQAIFAGSAPIYNVCSGENTSHRDLAGELARLTGAAIRLNDQGAVRRFPRLSNDLAVADLNLKTSSILSDLPKLVAETKESSDYV